MTKSSSYRQRLRRLLSQHYATKEKRLRTRLLRHLRLERPRYWWHERSLWQKLVCWVVILVTLALGSMYGIAQWYIASDAHQPLNLGVTFIPSYQAYFGIDPHQALNDIINDLGVQNVRFVSYWEEGEPTPGHYDFSQLDWQFKMAEQKNVKVSLSIGMRQPRWPECHEPDWAAQLPDGVWQQKLKDYMGVVIDRYKNSPVLDSYQLENEYFLKVFGECKDFRRARLIDEYNYVKAKDPNHTLVVSMSNNAIGSPIGQPTPDEFAISVYKRVWDKTLTKRYFEYPIPAWYYAFRAGYTKITTGRDSFIHELQAEAWLPDGYQINDVNDIAEQNKSMNAERLKGRFDYAIGTGMRKVDFWGVEWWYWRKEKANDPSLWNVAKQEFHAHTVPEANR